MKQVCLQGGQIVVVEVPAPVCRPDAVLVRTRHSLISSGTELATASSSGSTVRLLARAAADPALVRKVWDKVQSVGLRQTADLVRARQQSSLALGYSSSGTIIAVGENVRHLAVGDRVACAGAGYANHAEVNVVPVNLVAPIPTSVSDEDAAFATLGAIALQGVRRLEPELGDLVVVVGLGLLGQLTAQLLANAGCRVCGVDLRASRVDLARSLGMEHGVDGAGDMVQAVAAWTGGHMADGVIVCASGGDGQLLNRSFDLLRRKGRAVLVGDVPIRISREKIYRKELDFLISTSYGPGRYDPSYEERGVDYPRAYVRWTEGRNLSEVLRLIERRALHVRPLVGDAVQVDRAADAYATLAASEPPIAAMLAYPGETAADAGPRVVPVTAPETRGDRLVVGVLGAGSFFRGVHLPAMQRHGGFAIKYVAGRNGLAARDLAKASSIPFATTSAEEVLADPDVALVMVTTRHDSHAALTCQALDAGKHVFVEKPLGLSVAECDRVIDAARRSGRLVAVGFNRRFAPLARELRSHLQRIAGPKTIVYRVNAGALPADHWLCDPAEGGGRLRGEAVHFFDLVRWLAGARPVAVSATALVQSLDGRDPDNASVQLQFDDGSQATVLYVSQGSTDLGKERIECFAGGESFVLEDFRTLQIYGPSAATRDVKSIQKGHAELLAHVHAAVRGGTPLEVSAEDGYWATWCAERALASIGDRSRP